MRKTLSHILSEIEKQERQVSSSTTRMIDEAYQMTIYLQELLNTLKEYILKEGFKNNKEEINFFKNTKPQILGKLIYYNKVFRIETSCPVETGKVYHSYFSSQLHELKLDFRENISNSYFYRYYRLGREDRDEEYFTRGQINYHEGLNSFVFEIDPQFSTYYDYKAARIVANELLYTYLLTRISPGENPDHILLDGEATKDILWTQTKNALIELIYALYAASAISHGKIGIRKISLVFQILFRISLTDVHNSFHRMKTRSGSRTLFLDQLKASLEEYMDREDS